MSPTKIIVVFAICITILTIPLVVIDICYPALFGRHIGLVENVIAGVVGSLLIILLLDFTLRRRHEMALEKVSRVGLSEASVQINRIIDLFARMIKASSAGFVPTSIDDLFSDKAADLVSSHLALNKAAPVTPSISWRHHISNETKLVMNELTQIQNRYQAFFSERTLAEIAALRNNPLLNALQQIAQVAQSDAQMNIQRPVLNIPLDNLKPFMNDILISVKQVEHYAEKLKTNVVPRFSQRTFDDDVLPKLGDARFDGPPGPAFFIGKELPRISLPPVS